LKGGVKEREETTGSTVGAAGDGAPRGKRADSMEKCKKRLQAIEDDRESVRNLGPSSSNSFSSFLQVSQPGFRILEVAGQAGSKLGSTR